MTAARTPLSRPEVPRRASGPCHLSGTLEGEAMQVIRMHDYLTYAPKHTKPNVKALRRIMVSFFAATGIAFCICMLVITRNVKAINNSPPQRAAIHRCQCKAQCIR